MEETTNLKLIKPGLDDYVNVADLNENADIIDAAITSEKEKRTTHEADYTTFKSSKGKANGLAELDGNGIVPDTQLPEIEGVWVNLETVTLTKDTTQIIVPIPSDYKFFKVITHNLRSSGSSNKRLQMRLNNVSAANNYTSQYVGDAVTSSLRGTHVELGGLFMLNSVSAPTTYMIEITNSDYNISGTFSVMRSSTTSHGCTGTFATSFTGPVNSMTLFCNADGIASGTIIEVWGYK